MLYDRLYKPSEGEVLYHYCSPETLLAMCSYKTLRFSDLFSMNDFMEMHWGYHIWELAAGEMINSVGKELIDAIDNVLHNSGSKALALATCLSIGGDVLSQWRAYAKDGTGYAVGFNAKKLTQLAVRPLRVSYEKAKQVEEVKAFIKAIHEVESAEADKRGEHFCNACATLAFDIAGFKNPAFAEEQEVRLLHLLDFERSNNSLRLVDKGGTAFGHEALPNKVSYHMSGNTPVPHLDMDYSDSGKESPVVEVVLGPKNDSLLPGVSVFLETLGLPNVRVRKSTASYR